MPFESADDQLRAARQAFAALPDSVRAQAPQLPFLRQGCAAWNVPKAADWVRGSATPQCRPWRCPAVTTGRPARHQGNMSPSIFRMRSR
ncbi:putative hydrolase domain protein [Mycobacterium kansasii]|uniref:Putative hydrolase domain protein n=1 Tax=Mycobacterium kansasii TaxID=1768 RepID=A0A1V3XJT8_MYCKA|nr:putative hydrolase domain protein [Mycobacterium kansasii]